MAQVNEQTSARAEQMTQLKLEIWHPDCWTLQTTATTEAGLVAHGVYEYDEKVAARMTAYANKTTEIDDLIEEIRSSTLTIETRRINEYFNPNIESHVAGNATEQLLVEYKPGDSIHNAFVSRGFVPEDEIRVSGGYEYWTVFISEPRTEVNRRLDEIRDEENAIITVQGVKSPSTEPTHSNLSSELSERQREVFQLAQQNDYYSWPRGTSAGDLADELDISKTTLLEHLRKAESKLLGNNLL